MGFEFFLRHFAYVRTSYSICSRAESPKLLTVFNLDVDLVSLNSTIFFSKKCWKYAWCCRDDRNCCFQIFTAAADSLHGEAGPGSARQQGSDGSQALELAPC